MILSIYLSIYLGFSINYTGPICIPPLTQMGEESVAQSGTRRVRGTPQSTYITRCAPGQNGRPASHKAT